MYIYMYIYVYIPSIIIRYVYSEDSIGIVWVGICIGCYSELSEIESEFSDCMYDLGGGGWCAVLKKIQSGILKR
jgi:hypothetical protein